MAFSLSIAVVYLGFYLFIVFLSLSIACGLYYLAELIEEFTITTKRVIGHAIKAELVLHLLLLIDRPPLHCLALGFAAHLSYIRLLRRFPYMQLSSPEGLTAAGAFLASSSAWGFHYWRSYYTVEYILAFMLVTTWLVPFAFFLSMAGDQAVLPGAGGYPYSSTPGGSGNSGAGGYPYSSTPGGSWDGGQGRGKQRRGLALRLFDILRRKRDDVLPGVLAQMPASSGLMPKEKI